uniref:LamG domain-containing protein n=1 Tax=Oceanithermus sp. TaxID=2268145 RepID=UPI0025DA35C2
LLAGCVPNPVDLVVDRAIDTGVEQAVYKVLPQNDLPFDDGFERYPVGSMLLREAPRDYRVWDEGEAKTAVYVVEATGPEGRVEHAAAVEYPEVDEGRRHALTTGADGWTNYRVEMVFKTRDNPWWAYTHINSRGRHALVLKVHSRAAYLYKEVDGERTLVARRDLSSTYNDGAWHTLTAEVRPGALTLSVDGEVLVDYRDDDPAFYGGGFGVQANWRGSRFVISRWSFAPLP